MHWYVNYYDFIQTLVLLRNNFPVQYLHGSNSLRTGPELKYWNTFDQPLHTHVGGGEAPNSPVVVLSDRHLATTCGGERRRSRCWGHRFCPSRNSSVFKWSRSHSFRKTFRIFHHDNCKTFLHITKESHIIRGKIFSFTCGQPLGSSCRSRACSVFVLSICSPPHHSHRARYDSQ